MEQPAKGIATRSKKLLGAPGIATRNKDATRLLGAPAGTSTHRMASHSVQSCAVRGAIPGVWPLQRPHTDGQRPGEAKRSAEYVIESLLSIINGLI